LTDCVRTYSVDQGLEDVAPIAAGLGLKVMQGFWLSNDPRKNTLQIETAVELANRYPDVIRALVVGTRCCCAATSRPTRSPTSSARSRRG